MKKTQITYGIGSLNCRGLQMKNKVTQLADDMRQYKIDAMAVQETHIDTIDTVIITTDDKQSYTLYLSGKKGERRTEVGIVMRRDVNTTFTP